MTAAREREAAKATVAYQTALAAIGVRTVAELIQLWQSVPATARAATAERWLTDAVEATMRHRTESVALARAYYRLVRALVTGSTTKDPYKVEPLYVTLSTLRYEFAQLVAGDPQAAPEPTEGDDDRIKVEPLGDEKQHDLEVEDEAAQEARTVLAALGPNNLQKLVSKLDDSEPAKDVDKKRQDAHDRAGARQSAAGARVAMNGGRSTTWAAAEKDQRAIGWVRYSTTGTPCGFCAMLISRGAVYRSERSAKYGGVSEFDDGDLYHDNCHCATIPVFSRSQFDNAPEFDLNRKYGELWPEVTKGLGGESALSAWRRFIRTQQADEKVAAA